MHLMPLSHGRPDNYYLFVLVVPYVHSVVGCCVHMQVHVCTIVGKIMVHYMTSITSHTRTIHTPPTLHLHTTYTPLMTLYLSDHRGSLTWARGPLRLTLITLTVCSSHLLPLLDSSLPLFPCWMPPTVSIVTLSPAGSIYMQPHF